MGLADYSATPNDIAENPKNLKFIEADAAQLPRFLDDLAGAVINTNIILDAKIDPETALVRESGDSPYANIIVVRKGDKERTEIKELIAALTSNDVKSFLKRKVWFSCSSSILEGDKEMAYKVAFASSDGKVVNQHFGRTKQFLIVEIDNKDYKYKLKHELMNHLVKNLNILKMQ